MNKNIFEMSKTKIESKINEILDKEIEKYKDNEFIKESLEELKRLSSGGKRVRGYLVKLGAMLFGKDDEEKNNTFLALKNASGYIRREIGQRINLRYNPQIIFELDDSINYGMHIEELISKVKEK